MKKIKSFSTDFLFSSPSFIGGAGSIFNIAGNYFEFNYADNQSDADSKAILSDWGMIGTDIQIAIENLEKNLS
jgi:hypothetical protein